jgi:putative ABC transport system permease protein
LFILTFYRALPDQATGKIELAPPNFPLLKTAIYGVISYLAEERTREIGVRMALGARRSDVLVLVLGQAAKMVFLGIGMGLLLALGLTRLISSQLYGVTPHDPLTFGSAGLVLAVVALAACYIPAGKAMNVDPVVALRYE